MTEERDDLIYPGQRYRPGADEPRMRIRIADIAWGVFWGLFAWSVFAFLALFFFGALGAGLT